MVCCIRFVVHDESIRLRHGKETFETLAIRLLPDNGRFVYFEQQSKSRRHCYFYRNGTFTHTGIVIKVSGDRFWTVEGNTSGGSTIIANGGGVCQKSYYNSNLPGTKFCTPNYSLVKNTTPVSDSDVVKNRAPEPTLRR